MNFRRSPGFTLVEMMIVVVIVGLLAAMSVAVAGQNQSRSRMVATAHDVRGALAEARMRAVRTGRFHKVCLFSDSFPGDANGLGRALTFGCNGLGTACGTTTICNGVADDGTSYSGAVTDPSYLYADTFVTNPALIEKPTLATMMTYPGTNGCNPANTTLWCAVTDDAFQVATRTRVSIAGFLTGGTFSASDAYEVTYGPTGLIIPSSSTSPSAAIRILNSDYCSSNCAATYDGTTPIFRNVLDVNYTFGGAVRVR